MARSQNSFIKKQKEKQKQMKKKAKEERKKLRQENNDKGSDLADMMAYIDENGNIVSEPPEEAPAKDEKDSSKT
ncbi:cold-shock protein [Fulvivirga sp. M361]|uniref:cold-shock protein n=1 Tax=Fulvivirga sp. M361 TaxID=2594266 RepID=UPI00117ACA07|nr:cold-shock protein [Fulvivirga sp. M361]TRX50004.1 cold-shock protein [Fulvivirga sp. M361]